MGAKHFGARVKRLEDPALLAGRGRFVDDMKLPGLLHACFVRSTHAHARIRGIDSQAGDGHARRPCGARPRTTCPIRCAASGCRCCCPIRPSRRRARKRRWRATKSVTSASRSRWSSPIPATSPRTPRPRSSWITTCSPPSPIAAPRSRTVRRARTATSPRSHRALSARLWRHRCRLRRRRACFRGGDLAASRRRHGARDARRAGEPRSGVGHAHRVVRHADAASRPRHARRSARPRSRNDPHDRARCRRRLRPEGDVLSRGGGDPGGGAKTRPAGEMDRGPARAFPLRDPGARSVLGHGDRGRRRRQNSRAFAAGCCTTAARSCRGASSCPISPR